MARACVVLIAIDRGVRMSNAVPIELSDDSRIFVLSRAEFVQKFEKDTGEDDLSLIRRAYIIGEALHRGQTRDEGTPYFNHPIRVAMVLSDELNRREATILCGALLHDVVEDSDITVEDLRAMFNPEIADAVRLLTKNGGVETVDYLRAIEEESPGVALPIKLGDRLDNLRGLHLSRKPNKRAKYLGETMKYFVPLAERHNMYVHDQFRKLINLLS